MTRANQIATIARQLYSSAQAQRVSCRCTNVTFDDAADTVQSFYVRLACDIVDRWFFEPIELSA